MCYSNNFGVDNINSSNSTSNDDDDDGNNSNKWSVICHKAASLPPTDCSIAFAKYVLVRHIGTTWRIRFNLCFLRPARVHNPNASRPVQPVLHSSRQKVPILYNGHPFHNNCPLPRRIWTPSLIHDSLGPSEHITQTASRSLQPFLHR